VPLFEYWNISDPALASCWGDFWQGQTFTPRAAHTVESVKLRMYRVGSPGTVTVSIKATDVDGHPTGGDLASGTTDGDMLPVEYSGEWREVSLGAGAALDADAKYAIVVRALGGDQNDYVRCRWSGPGPYPRGAHEFSSDAGATWETDGGRDLMFEEWGSPA
jgi:hypothetical protein